MRGCSTSETFADQCPPGPARAAPTGVPPSVIVTIRPAGALPLSGIRVPDTVSGPVTVTATTGTVTGSSGSTATPPGPG